MRFLTRNKINSKQNIFIMKRNLFSKIYATVTIILLCSILSAQQFPCGTTVDQAQKNFENTFIDSVSQITPLYRTVHITVYITKNNQGQTNVNLATIDASVALLNQAFDPVKVTFKLAAVNYIDNYHFDIIHMATNEKYLVAQNYTANTINIYFVSELYSTAEQQICGYTYYPSKSKDVILINKNCLNEAFIVEQIGHFFNLYHTHETTFGNELVNRSNCGTAGDLCCDTPADPGLTGKVATNCQYTGTSSDANGSYYTPTTNNFMSLSPLACRCFFSDKQLIRMINCMLKTKSHLW
jgi:hypothetical protein